jgi:hypothetical protein
MKRIFLLKLSCALMIFAAQPIVAATNEFSPDSIKSLMRKVANYRLKSGVQAVGNGWDGGSYFSGIMGLYRTTKEQKYLDSATAWGNSNNWMPHNGVNTTVGDDQCCEQTYCEVYGLNPTTANAKMIQNVKSNLEHEFDVVRNSHTNVWTWCDLCYMSPPAITRYAIASVANQPRFLDYNGPVPGGARRKCCMIPPTIFGFRDGSYTNNQKTSNGNPVFWSCGEAWVLGGMAQDTCLHAKNIRYTRKMGKAIRGRVHGNQGPAGFYALSGAVDHEHARPPAVARPRNVRVRFFLFCHDVGRQQPYSGFDLVYTLCKESLDRSCSQCQRSGHAPALSKSERGSQQHSREFIVARRRRGFYAERGGACQMGPGRHLDFPARGLRRLPLPETGARASRPTAAGISFFLTDPRRSVLRIYDLTGALLADRSGAC